MVYTTQLTFRRIISIETAFLSRILTSVCLNLYLCPSGVICVTAGLEQLRSAESTLEYSPLLSKLSITLYSSRNCRPSSRRQESRRHRHMQILANLYTIRGRLSANQTSRLVI